MKRIALLLSFILAVVLYSAAQDPIRWRMSVKMTGEDSGTVTLRALVAPGWHLYGTSLPENGPHPTRFEFKLAGVSLDGHMIPSRKPVSHQDSLFGMELSWWDSNVEFTQPFKLIERGSAAEGNQARISVTVNYMGCNDATCLPPKSQTLTYVFK